MCAHRCVLPKACAFMVLCSSLGLLRMETRSHLNLKHPCEVDLPNPGVNTFLNEHRKTNPLVFVRYTAPSDVSFLDSIPKTTSASAI